jgi:hypothetical protein
VGDREKLLTYLNSALKVLPGLDIFPRGTKKKLNFVDQCNWCTCWFFTYILMGILIFKGLTARRLYTSLGVKG